MEKLTWKEIENLNKSYNYKWSCMCNLKPSLVLQWLRLRAPKAGGPGSLPGQEPRSHMAQLKDLSYLS